MKPADKKPPPLIPTPQPRAARRWSTFALGAFILVAAFAPFIPAITAGFIAFDDPGVLQDVDGYRGLGPANLRWMFTTTHMGHYQPLTWVSYAVDYLVWGRGPAATWGLNPVGFHFTNMLVHAANALLVYLLARPLLVAALMPAPSPDPAPAGPTLPIELAATAAALLFAVHPLRVESVAWVTERRDVLSACFWLLAMLAYLRAFPARTAATASKGWYAASIALLVLSLLCKAWGMTFFVVLIVLDWFPLGRLSGPVWSWLRRPTRSVLVQKAPYAALGIAAALMAGYATGSVRFTVLSLEQWGIGARLTQAMYGLMFYLQKTVWPTRLSAIYELPRVLDAWEPRFLAAYVFTGAAAVAAFALRRRFPAFTAAAIAYAVILLPVLGIRQSGPQLVADRYSYLATIVWALLGAGAVLTWARRTNGKGAIQTVALGLVLTGTLAGLTWRQTHFWRDSEALFKHAIDSGADGPIAREFYGRQLSERGRKEEALVQFRTGTELDPGYAECWFSEADTLKDLGRFREAEESFLVARKLMADSWRANILLGVMFIDKLDRPKDAEACFRAAIANVESLKLEPLPGRPYLMLAAALDIQGDERGARQMLEKAAQCRDTRDEALQHLREMDTPAPK